MSWLIFFAGAFLGAVFPVRLALRGLISLVALLNPMWAMRLAYFLDDLIRG
jgi:hypothetical protein